jgi:hypothetical protein
MMAFKESAYNEIRTTLGGSSEYVGYGSKLSHVRDTKCLDAEHEIHERHGTHSKCLPPDVRIGTNTRIRSYNARQKFRPSRKVLDISQNVRSNPNGIDLRVARDRAVKDNEQSPTDPPCI